MTVKKSTTTAKKTKKLAKRVPFAGLTKLLNSSTSALALR